MSGSWESLSLRLQAGTSERRPNMNTLFGLLFGSNTIRIEYSVQPKPIVLRAINDISTLLCTTFRKSFDIGQVPDCWKCADVSAVFKMGSKDDPGNYRPVTVSLMLRSTGIVNSCLLWV